MSVVYAICWWGKVLVTIFFFRSASSLRRFSRASREVRSFSGSKSLSMGSCPWAGSPIFCMFIRMTLSWSIIISWFVRILCRRAKNKDKHVIYVILTDNKLYLPVKTNLERDMSIYLINHLRARPLKVTVPDCCASEFPIDWLGSGLFSARRGSGLVTECLGSGLVICFGVSSFWTLLFIADSIAKFGPVIFGAGGNNPFCLTKSSSLLSKWMFGLVRGHRK